MNFEFFIASRIVGKYKGNLSRPFINIAVLSITLGLAIMIVSISILTGFQKEIENKIIGFGSHIQITNYDANTSYEFAPVLKNQSFYYHFNKKEGIKHIEVFGIKAGIIKTNEQIQGVLLKGIGSDYDWSFFKNKIIKGKAFTVNDSVRGEEVLISALIADKLKLKVNDNVFMYFVQDPPRVRKFKICGIYETGLEDFDKMYVIGDLAQVQKLNNWTANEVSGFEILINNFKDLDKVYQFVYHNIGYNLNAQTIKQLYPEIFDWLDLMDMNVAIILIIMLLVTGITMVCTLLVLILEKTNMVGILKAIGLRNNSVRQIFLYNATYIIFKGLILGNALAFTLCFVQHKFNIISLPQESYYMSYVPVNLEPLPVILLNLGTFIISIIILVIPSHIISRISPVKTISYR